MWRLYYQLSAEAKARYFDEIIPLLHDTKASVLGDRDHDSWYLVFLGTKPSARGRGYAKKLLEDMTQRVRFVLSYFCFRPMARSPSPVYPVLSLAPSLSLSLSLSLSVAVSTSSCAYRIERFQHECKPERRFFTR